MKLLNIKTIVGILLIVISLWPSSKPVDNPVVLLNIDKPSNDIIELVKPIANQISDPTDRAKLAIFNYTFSQRVTGYDTDLQKLNDVYVLAASKFFKDSIVNKYNDLDTSIVKLIESVTTSDNHVLSEEEKKKLLEYFSGLSWALIQRK